jgi:hypothetical protein
VQNNNTVTFLYPKMRPIIMWTLRNYYKNMQVIIVTKRGTVSVDLAERTDLDTYRDL